MQFAMIGAGMVGICYLKALLEQGHQLVGLCDVSLSASAKASLPNPQAQAFDAPGAWLGEADMVVSAVFGTAAVQVFEDCLPFLREGCLYVDMTTADPAGMRRCAQGAEAAGVAFTDVAITGAVNLGGKKTPLLVAGPQAQTVAQLFRPMGATVRVVGEHPGEAVSLKLLRSIYTKGVEALAVECLVTAERMGLRKQLFEVLQDIDETPLPVLLESMAQTHIPHSGRRRNEVREAREQMAQLGLQSRVSPGIEALFTQSAQAHKETPYMGDSVEQALQWLTRHVLAEPATDRPRA